MKSQESGLSSNTTISFRRSLTLLSVAIFCTWISIYLFSSFMAEYARFSLTRLEKTLITLFFAAGLPITLFLITQISLQWRGLKNAVWSILWGALITLLGNLPLAFELIA